MGCVEALTTRPLSHGCRRASSPKGGAKYVRYQKLAQSQVSPPPLGEVSCQRHDGEGSVKPPSRCATGREKRCAVSLAFFYALRAYKGKVKVETFLKKSFIKKLYARFARPSFHFFHLYL